MLLQIHPRFRFFSFIWMIAFSSTISFLISLLIFNVTQSYLLTGVLLGLFGLTAFISMPFAIALHQKKNIRRTLSAATFILAFLFLFYTFATNIWQLLLLRAMHGFLFAFIISAILMLKAENKSHVRDFFITVAPLFFGFLAIFNFNISFYLAFLITIAASFLIFNLTPNTSSKPDSFSYLFMLALNDIKKKFSFELFPTLFSLSAIASFSNFLPIILASDFNPLSLGSAFSILLFPLFLLADSVKKLKRKAKILGVVTMVLVLILNSLVFIPVVFYLTLFLFALGFSLFISNLNNYPMIFLAIFIGCLFGVVFKLAPFIGFFSLAVLLLTCMLVEVIRKWISSRRLKIEEE